MLTQNVLIIIYYTRFLSLNPVMVYRRFYLFINLGSAVAFSVMVYIQQDISFTLGYFIPAMFMIFAVVIFVAARKKYVQHVPGGKPHIMVRIQK